MSSGITSSDSMFSVREMPWHQQGAILDEYPNGIDEALTLSGLDWRVEQRGVYVPTAPELGDEGVSQGFAQVPGKLANVRSDSGAVLGVVSDGYQVVQNVEAFRFLDDVLGTDELQFETAGSLHGGRQVWVLARRPDHVEVAGDQVATFVFVASSHDGSMSVTAAVTPVRIVCANTLGWALEGASQAFRMRHTAGIGDRWEDAREMMRLTVDYESQFVALGDKLGREKISDNAFEGVLDGLFPEADSMGARALENRRKAKRQIMTIYHGAGLDGDTTGNAPGTKWAAVNAVGEWSDWYRQRNKNTEQMLRSFEDGALKQRALKALVAA